MCSVTSDLERRWTRAGHSSVVGLAHGGTDGVSTASGRSVACGMAASDCVACCPPANGREGPRRHGTAQAGLVCGIPDDRVSVGGYFGHCHGSGRINTGQCKQPTGHLLVCCNINAGYTDKSPTCLLCCSPATAVSRDSITPSQAASLYPTVSSRRCSAQNPRVRGGD